jgi:hypothetical protein
MCFLDISKERGSVGLGGVENATLMSKSIVDQLNYAKTAKHIDLKILKNELKQAIESRLSKATPLIDFQSLLTSVGRLLSEEMIEHCSISYYLFFTFGMIKNWGLTSQSLNNLRVNTAQKQ